MDLLVPSDIVEKPEKLAKKNGAASPKAPRLSESNPLNRQEKRVTS